MPDEPYFLQRPEDLDRIHLGIHIADPAITVLHFDVSGARAEARLRTAFSGELPVVGACYAYVCTAMVQEEDRIRITMQLRRLDLPDQSQVSK